MSFERFDSVAAGPATITLPDRITDEDRLRVVQAVLETPTGR